MDSEIIKMRLALFGYRAIATALNTNRDHVRSVCLRNNLGGVMAEPTPKVSRADAVVQHRHCEVCGDVVKTTGPGRIPKRCASCRGSARCANCGAVYVQDKNAFCSHNCKVQYAIRTDVVPGKCQHCGQQPADSGKGMYCSISCANRAKGINMLTQECTVCGADYKTYNKGQKYCSLDCRGKSQRTLKGTTRICVVCGLEYEPTQRNQKCCGADCAIVRRTMTQQISFFSTTCLACGVKFNAYGIRGTQKYCSRRCGDKYYRENNKNKIREKQARYRARKASGEVETFNREDVYERDNWLCGVCNQPVDAQLEYPHPMSASLDHIIPLSRGGDHTRINTQLTHLRCNMSKGNSMVV